MTDQEWKEFTREVIADGAEALAAYYRCSFQCDCLICQAARASIITTNTRGFEGEMNRTTDLDGNVQCEQCQHWTTEWNYCGNCGAKMNQGLERRHIEILGQRIRLVLENGDKPLASLPAGEYQAKFLRALAEKLEEEERKEHG